MSKVLIVEDELSIAELEKDYLELSSFEVEIETDGQQEMCIRDRCGFDEDAALKALKPLTVTNMNNIFDVGTCDALTGPVERCV